MDRLIAMKATTRLLCDQAERVAKGGKPVCEHGVNGALGACEACIRKYALEAVEELKAKGARPGDVDECEGFHTAVTSFRGAVNGAMHMVRQGKDPMYVLSQLALLLEMYSISNQVIKSALVEGFNARKDAN